MRHRQKTIQSWSFAKDAMNVQVWRVWEFNLDYLAISAFLQWPHSINSNT